MRVLLRLIATAALAGTILFLDAATSQAQTAADLFNDQVIQELRLFVNSRDLKVLREKYRENTYYTADLLWKGLRVRNVGIRSRGSGSRNANKMGLRIDFGRYTKKQQFVGLDSLILDNIWQDASFVREMLSMSVYRRLGQIAPREAFAKLYINNEYQGLYAVVEEIDMSFVKRSLNETNGYLFEYNYVQPFFTEYLGDDFTPYKAMFQPKNHELEGDNVLYGPIRDLFREINGPDDVVWRSRVEERIDVANFMTHAAIQGFLAENDGLLGYAGLNNFYVYRLANTNRHRLFPWDEDFSFSFISSSLLRRGEQPVVLFERAFAQPDYRQLFLDVAEACAHDVTENGWLSSELERFVGLITPSVLEDARKQFSNEAYFAEIDFIREFAATRTQYVLKEIAQLRQP